MDRCEVSPRAMMDVHRIIGRLGFELVCRSHEAFPHEPFTEEDFYRTIDESPYLPPNFA